MADTRPIMTDAALFTWDGHFWLVSDGEFPFDDCQDKCSSDRHRESVKADWRRRVALAEKRNAERLKLSLTWAQYYSERS